MITTKEATVFVTSCSLGYHALVEFAQANFFCIAPL
jgi:hypothetical protein